MTTSGQDPLDKGPVHGHVPAVGLCSSQTKSLFEGQRGYSNTIASGMMQTLAALELPSASINDSGLSLSLDVHSGRCVLKVIPSGIGEEA